MSRIYRPLQNFQRISSGRDKIFTWISSPQLRHNWRQKFTAVFGKGVR